MKTQDEEWNGFDSIDILTIVGIMDEIKDYDGESYKKLYEYYKEVVLEYTKNRLKKIQKLKRKTYGEQTNQLTRSSIKN